MIFHQVSQCSSRTMALDAEITYFYTIGKVMNLLFILQAYPD